MSRRFAARYGPWALVTGASAGIGEAFAHQIAARGLHVALVARREDRMNVIAERIEARFGVRTRVIAADLSAPDGPARVIEAMDDDRVGLLVNNAGAGRTGRFLDHAIDDELATLDLNCRAPLILTHHFGRAMRRRGRGGVIMLASIAGILPVPEFAGYSASKAWNRFLGEALHAELAGDGVDVVSLCPGLTESEFFAKAGVDPERWPRPLRAGTILSADAVARAGLDGLGRQTQVVPGFGYRWLMRAGRIAPGWLPLGISERVMRRALGPSGSHDAHSEESP